MFLLTSYHRTAPANPFVPRYCVLDKKVLRFFGHFYENIPDGMGVETTRYLLMIHFNFECAYQLF